MKIILISGYDRSGKSTFGDVLMNKGYSILELGEVVKKELVKQDVEKTKITDFYNEHLEYLNEQIMNCLDGLLTKNDKISISGCRSYSLFKKIIKRCNPNYRFFVDTNQNIRYERYLGADKYGRCYDDLESFISHDLIHAQWGIEKIKRESVLIENNNSFEEYIKGLNDLILNYALC